MTDNAKSPILSKNVSSSIGLAPPLRFSGFEGEWSGTKLSRLFQKITQKNKSGVITNVICNSAKNGLIPQRDFFDKDIANVENTNGYFIIQKNDFVYNPRKSNDAPYGPISTYKHEEDGIVSPLYLCFRPSRDIDVRYFDAYFKSTVWHRYIYFAGDSGARHDRVSIKDENFFAMPVNIPVLPEQQKIADFLSLVDERIEKQRQLVEVLKRYKRGLFLLLFDGKQQNNILSQIIEYGKAGGTPTSTNKNYYSGTIPFLSISDMTAQGKFLRNTEKHISELGLKNSTAWLVPANSLIISMYASYGLVSINTIPITTSQAMFSIIPKDETDTEYLYYYLSYLSTTGYYDKMVSTGTQANLNAEKVKNIPIYFPSKEERTKIKVILKTFDEMEDAENRKLETLLDIKSGLLQQMFI